MNGSIYMMGKIGPEEKEKKNKSTDQLSKLLLLH
jgi:hypothetical protein